jgi:hypothetical protein
MLRVDSLVLTPLTTPKTIRGKKTVVRVVPTPSNRQSLVITSTPVRTRDGERLNRRTFLVVAWDKKPDDGRPDRVQILA